MPLYLAAKLQIKIERTKKKGEKLASFSLDYNELINVSQSITAILENLKCLSFLVNKTSAPTVIAELYLRISSKSGLSISNALYSSFSPEGATCTILQSFFINSNVLALPISLRSTYMALATVMLVIYNSICLRTPICNTVAAEA